MCQLYLQQVQHNGHVLELLSSSASQANPTVDVSDWKVTLLFYIACLYVRALADKRGVTIERHTDARAWLNAELDIVTIARSYRKLEERSRDARYEGRRFNTSELVELHRWYCEVRDRVVALLTSAGVSPAPSVEPREALLRT